MCVEAMDTATSKRIRSGILRKTAAWKLQWRLLRVSAEEDEARKESRAAIRKPLRRHHRRAQLVKLARALGSMSREGTTTTPAVEECKPFPYLHRHHPGAMAPENTTQYLMSNTYDDMCDQDGGATVTNEAYSHLRETLRTNSAVSGTSERQRTTFPRNFRIKTHEKWRTGRCPPTRERS